MTLIAGLVEGGTIWMAGDSAASDMENHALTLMANRKVFVVGETLIGVCGEPRVADVLRYQLELPKLAKRADPDRYVRTAFMDAVRETLKKAGTIHVQNGVEMIDAGLLVGLRGKLYMVESSLMAMEVIDDYAAMGSGRDVALGALAVSQGVPARKRLLNALHATERYIVSVRRPFYVLTSP